MMKKKKEEEEVEEVVEEEEVEDDEDVKIELPKIISGKTTIESKSINKNINKNENKQTENKKTENKKTENKKILDFDDFLQNKSDKNNNIDFEVDFDKINKSNKSKKKR